MAQPQLRAVNSVVECHLHTVEVTSSNLVPPTKISILQTRMAVTVADELIRLSVATPRKHSHVITNLL